MGPNTEKILNATHHVDTYSIMREIIDGNSQPSLLNTPGGNWYLYVGIGLGVLGVGGLSTFLLVKKLRRKRTN
jgi:hypothetical protein